MWKPGSRKWLLFSRGRVDGYRSGLLGRGLSKVVVWRSGGLGEETLGFGRGTVGPLFAKVIQPGRIPPLV